MKNIILFSIVFLSALKFQGQQQIFRYQDDMTDKVYYFTSGLMVTNEDKSQGFRLQLDIKEIDDKTLAFDGLTLKVIGIGTCFEKDNLILLFENGKKMSVNSYNDFNCEGDSWFVLNDGNSETYIDLLKSQKLIKIRFENGSSHESLTQEISEKNQNYFIELFKLIAENKVTPYTGK